MIKERGRMKLLTASAGGTLEADADESFKVTDIFCVPGAGETYVDLLVAGTAVGRYRALGKTGNHIPAPMVKTTQVYEQTVRTLLAWALLHGFDMSIPVASGETLTVSRVAAVGWVVLVYDVGDAGEFTPDMPNGSKSNIRRYVHYGENADAVTVSPAAIDTSLIWTGGEQFPFNGSAVAEKNRFRIMAIVGAPAARGNATLNKGYTTHLTLLLRNNVLFDEDRSGLPLLGVIGTVADAVCYDSAGSLIGPNTAEWPSPGLWLPDPIVLNEGDKLTTQIIVADAAAAGIAASELDVAYVMEQEYGVG